MRLSSLGSLARQSSRSLNFPAARRSSAHRVAVRVLAAAVLPMATASVNPLLADWSSSEPYGLPPFSRVTPELFKPAFEHAMHAHLEQLHAIASSSEPPTFENTVAALDRAGEQLNSISNLFSNLCSSATG